VPAGGCFGSAELPGFDLPHMLTRYKGKCS